MNGLIDQNGRALLSIIVSANLNTSAASINAWIDTGFTGDLVVANSLIAEMQLPQSGTVDAILADGSLVELPTYTCFVDWFGRRRQLEVVSNDGEYALLGVGLLVGLELRLNYRTLELSLDEG